MSQIKLFQNQIFFDNSINRLSIKLQIIYNFYLKTQYISKKMNKLQPIKKSSINKNPIQISTKSKRVISLKPIIMANNAICKNNRIKDDLKTNRKQQKNKKKSSKQLTEQQGKGFDHMIVRNNQCKTRATSINSLQIKKQGLSSRQLYQRKQSNLNTYFNIRMNKLKDITKQNKRIYQRLNSQKSLYSNKSLNESFQSSNNLSRRLSQSKLSKASSIRSISMKNNNKKSARNLISKVNKVEKPIKIQSHSIKNIAQGEVQRYLQIFGNNNTNIQASYNKKNIIMLNNNGNNMKIDKENSGIPVKFSLQGILQQVKTKGKTKKSINFPHLL